MAAGKHAGQNAYYCTAQYSPPGNIQGKYRENVLNYSPPSSVSKRERSFNGEMASI